MEVRSQVRAARRNVPKPYATQASFKFSERIAELPGYRNAKVVAGFLPFDGEADPLPLMDRAILENKQVYVPTIVAKAQPLKFVPWTRETPTKLNQFGIAEPKVDANLWLDGSQLDCVITPLVAFDERCHRMGVGGGFYDRTFEFVNGVPSDARKTVLIGIAYELQRVEKVSVQPHDVRLDAIVSELTTYLPV